MISIDSAWLAAAPVDMRAGTDTALARVIATFGAAHPYHAYVFANQRSQSSLASSGIFAMALYGMKTEQGAMDSN